MSSIAVDDVPETAGGISAETQARMATRELLDELGWRKPTAARIRQLLALGADPNDSESEVAPLALALENDNYEVIQALLDAGAGINRTDEFGVTLLNDLAAGGGSSRKIAFLLSKGANPNLPNAEGNTPLHVAAHSISAYATSEVLATARQLLGSKARVDARNNDGQQPLHMALNRIDAGNLSARQEGAIRDMVEMLIEAGAPINQPSGNGCTPLFLASNLCTASIVKQLLVAGANVRQESHHGRSALHAARDPAIVELLVAAGADVAAVDWDGCSPLHVASSAKVACALLEHGADCHARDNHGHVPLASVLMALEEAWVSAALRVDYTILGELIEADDGACLDWRDATDNPDSAPRVLLRRLAETQPNEQHEDAHLYVQALLARLAAKQAMETMPVLRKVS
jgi:ankyrin repeat protein